VQFSTWLPSCFYWTTEASTAGLWCLRMLSGALSWGYLAQGCSTDIWCVIPRLPCCVRQVKGFVSNMPDVMAACTCIITKVGKLT